MTHILDVTREETFKNCNLIKYLTESCCGVVVITSVLHTEDPQFDPGQQHFRF